MQGHLPLVKEKNYVFSVKNDIFPGEKKNNLSRCLLWKKIADWERREKVEIWLQIPMIFDMPKNWEWDWATVGALFVTFEPKTSYWEYWHFRRCYQIDNSTEEHQWIDIPVREVFQKLLSRMSFLFLSYPALLLSDC